MNARKQSSGDASLGSGRLLAAIAVLAVAFVVLAAIPAVADDSDATGATTISSTDLLNKAVNGVLTLDQNYALSGSLEVSSNLTIDLKGFELSGTGFHIIEVKSGKLVIKDTSESKSGTVVQAGIEKAALIIDESAEAQIDGGYFHNTNASAWYVIKNEGIAVFNDGIVRNESTFSSAINNGYQNGTEKTNSPTMTINGGQFNGNQYVKNDDRGIMYIYGGVFGSSESRGSALLNWNEMTIGSEDGTKMPKFNGTSGAVVLNGYMNDEMDSGKLTVNAIAKNDSLSLVGIGTITNKDNVITGYYGFGSIVLKSSGVWSGDIFNEPKGAEFNGTIQVGESKVEFTKIKAGTDGIIIKSGSVNISGSVTATETNAKISATSGDIILKDLTLASGEILLNGGVSATIKGTVTIDNGASLSVNKNAVVTVSGKLAGDGNVTNNGTINILTGGSASTDVTGNEPTYTPDFVPMPPTEDDFPGYVPSQTVEKEKKDDSTTQVAIVAAAIAVVLVAIIALLYKSR